MTDEAMEVPEAPAAVKTTKKKPSSRVQKVRTSLLAKLTPDAFKVLRLDEGTRAEFDMIAKRFEDSRVDSQAFDGEDTSSMENDRYDQHSAARSQKHSTGMAVVHFLAPRILKLREGEAKRKWRSDLAKFRKEEGLV